MEINKLNSQNQSSSAVTTKLKYQWYSLLLLFIYGGLILIRVPDLILSGRFWGEEGAVYFAFSYTEPFFKTLFFTHLGYYSLLNNFSALAAVHLVPLEYAPYITTGIAFLVQLLPAMLIVFNSRELFGSRLLTTAAVAIILFSLPNHEVWLNTINSHFYLAIVTAVILILPAPQGKRSLFYLGLLLLVGFSGVVSLFLIPFFWLKSYLEKSKDRMIQALLLTFCSCLQAAVFFFYSDDS
ncbi:hypothetical protein ACFLQ1_01140 [Candidatus Auribacterota bacterium]